MLEFKWQESYSVGNDDLDNHHRKLIALFNEVAKLVEQDKEAPLFSSIRVISELNVYAVFHFKEEEKLMEAVGYDRLSLHKEKHAEFIAKVRQFKDDYMHNDPLVNFEMFNFLSDWIVNHIMEEDALYSDHI